MCDWVTSAILFVMPLRTFHLALCFIQQGVTLTEDLMQMTCFLLVLWFDITHTKTSTVIDRYKRLIQLSKYILTPNATCWQQLSVLAWMNISLISDICLLKICLGFQNYSPTKVTHLRIGFAKPKFFLLNTLHTHRNGVNEQNIEMHIHTHWEINNIK